MNKLILAILAILALPVAFACHCGDGSINVAGEQCEKPGTLNNNFCSQSVSTCNGTMYGTRDSKGNCNSQCKCTFDPYVFTCVVGQCGAVCDSDDDCLDGNVYTIDTCSGCKCEHEPVPYCGDGIFQPETEQCETDSDCGNGYCENCTCQENEVPEFGAFGAIAAVSASIFGITIMRRK